MMRRDELMNTLMNWSTEYVAIDEGGLALVELTEAAEETENSIEVGGVPEDDDDDEETALDAESKCGCGATKDVEPRYSFGEYAGRLCPECCRKFRDHCGIDQGQGDPTELDEFARGGRDAIEGEG
jgi:hypothetical protein